MKAPTVSEAAQNMIAGLISPPVESPGQESDNDDSLPGKGSYTSSHALSDDEQPAILLLNDSTSSSHAIREGRQAIPVTPDRLTASPRLKLLANIALSLVVAPLRTTTVCLQPTAAQASVFIQRTVCVAGTTTIVVAQLRRSRSLLERAAQSAV